MMCVFKMGAEEKIARKNTASEGGREKEEEANLENV